MFHNFSECNVIRHREVCSHLRHLMW